MYELEYLRDLLMAEARERFFQAEQKGLYLDEETPLQATVPINNGFQSWIPCSLPVSLFEESGQASASMDVRYCTCLRLRRENKTLDQYSCKVAVGKAIQSGEHIY